MLFNFLPWQTTCQHVTAILSAPILIFLLPFGASSNFLFCDEKFLLKAYKAICIDKRMTGVLLPFNFASSTLF